MFVVTVGDTTTLLPMSPPGFQVYDVAPKAVSVEFGLLQVIGFETEVVREITVPVTLTDKVLVLEHNPEFPVTVYIVVTVGLVTIVFPIKASLASMYN